MSEYLYYCKNCRILEVSRRDNEKIICEECGEKCYPLHVTERDWDKMDKSAKRETLMNAMTPSGKLTKANNDNSHLKSQNQLQSEENGTNRIKEILLKLADSNENQTSKLSIIGFIFSFLGCLSFIGLAAGIFDLVKGKGKKSLSIAAVVISSIMMLGTIGLAGGTSDSSGERIMAESFEEDELLDDKQDFSTEVSTPTPTPTQTITPVPMAAADDETVEESNAFENSEDNSVVSDQLNETIMYATDKVNIRQQPNTECEVLGKANVGDEVVVLEVGADGWSYVNCGGVDGYIKSEYLSEHEPTKNVAAQKNDVQKIPAPDANLQAGTGLGAAVAAGTAVQSATTGGGGNGDNFHTYDIPEQQQTSDNWVLNTSKMKIHYPSCSSVRSISPENYSTSNLSVAELQLQGYDPCGRCHPH